MSEVAYLSATVEAMQTNKQETDTELMSPGEAAAALYVSTRTLQRMAIRGDIHAVILPSGHRRYQRADVEALLKQEVA